MWDYVYFQIKERQLGKQASTVNNNKNKNTRVRQNPTNGRRGEKREREKRGTGTGTGGSGEVHFLRDDLQYLMGEESLTLVLYLSRLT